MPVPHNPPSYPVRAPLREPTLTPRVAYLGLLAMGLAVLAALAARLLTALIGLVTNLAFYGKFSFAFSSPASNRLGLWVILVPVLGGLLVGLLARYGSAAIRGHGIPEAMEQILYGRSRIPVRLTILKPLSAAIAIGTGGPFGAEGPIIATGGALGSVVGQLLHITPDERKILLASGAAAGMTAIFGCPVSAVLLAIELLLFEYRAGSIIPVALACATAQGMRLALWGSLPIFAMDSVLTPSLRGLAVYILLGALVGLASVGTTRAIYWIEDLFDRIPIHWMWWPALGGFAVGAIGYLSPRTLGVGYDNIEDIINGRFLGAALAALVLLKFLSWAISLGSGTSGGTLAPLFTIGGGLGALAGTFVSRVFPAVGVDVRIAAIVGMAAMFAGASRALLASVVFAFETTRQPLSLMPLLGGCAAAYLVSSLLMRNSIMTEKIARRGGRVPEHYAADHLHQVLVREVATRRVVTLSADARVADVQDWLASKVDGTGHQGFPVQSASGKLLGVVTRRDIFSPNAAPAALLSELLQKPLAVAFEDNSLREAADHMIAEGVGRLPVVAREDPTVLTGWLTRSDLLLAHRQRLRNASEPSREIQFRQPAASRPRPESS